MKKMTKQFLNLMFNSDEHICISPDKYGYHSVPQEVVNGDVVLLSPNEDISPKVITEKDITMIAINPIKGYRRDIDVTAYRSFLVELDEGSLASQKEYIERMQMPYSVCVFSGNKSLHYGIVLDCDVPRSAWKHIAQWILNVVKNADQQVKNPSRGIRFPGNRRPDGKQKIQSLIGINKRISLDVLFDWLNEYPSEKPKIVRKKVGRLNINGVRRVPQRVYKMLEDGVDDNRNNTWFSLACSMIGAGYSEDYTMNYFEEHFEEDNDFKRNEWETCIKSAYKYMQGVL